MTQQQLKNRRDRFVKQIAVVGRNHGGWKELEVIGIIVGSQDALPSESYHILLELSNGSVKLS